MYQTQLVGLSEILPLRKMFLDEHFVQIRYNAVHERGWSDSYLISKDGHPIGYGSVKGSDRIEDRNTLFEFFLIPSERPHAAKIFKQLLDVTSVMWIESQSNEPLLTSLLHHFATDIESEVILFKQGPSSHLTLAGATFRARGKDEQTFDHQSEPEGPFVIQRNGEIIATGGFLLHYNFPFADLYMEVREDQRRQGVGSFLIQELIKSCTVMGRVPAARCHVTNVASKATLIRGGMEIAGQLLKGAVANPN